MSGCFCREPPTVPREPASSIRLRVTLKGLNIPHSSLSLMVKNSSCLERFCQFLAGSFISGTETMYERRLADKPGCKKIDSPAHQKHRAKSVRRSQRK